jgi:hypothetical protein
MYENLAPGTLNAKYPLLVVIYKFKNILGKKIFIIDCKRASDFVTLSLSISIYPQHLCVHIQLCILTVREMNNFFFKYKLTTTRNYKSV